MASSQSDNTNCYAKRHGTTMQECYPQPYPTDASRGWSMHSHVNGGGFAGYNSPSSMAQNTSNNIGLSPEELQKCRNPPPPPPSLPGPETSPYPPCRPPNNFGYPANQSNDWYQPPTPGTFSPRDYMKFMPTGHGPINPAIFGNSLGFPYARVIKFDQSSDTKKLANMSYDPEIWDAFYARYSSPDLRDETAHVPALGRGEYHRMFSNTGTTAATAPVPLQLIPGPICEQVANATQKRRSMLDRTHHRVQTGWNKPSITPIRTNWTCRDNIKPLKFESSSSSTDVTSEGDDDDSGTVRSWHNKANSDSVLSKTRTRVGLWVPDKTEKKRVSRWDAGDENTDKIQKPKYSSEWMERFKENYDKDDTPPFIDSHCHIDMLLERLSFDGGFGKFKTQESSTFPSSYQGCIAVFCNPRHFHSLGGKWSTILEEPNVWGAVGCHPKSATDFNDRAQENMWRMLKHPKVKAVGEIGLDYSGTFKQHEEIQKKVLAKQCQMAKELNMPIVIHSRDSEEDIVAELQKLQLTKHRIHRHCFTGNWEEAQLWLDLFSNSFIGLTPLITWKSSPRAYGPRGVALKIPLDRLLLETDAPYFLPRCIPKEEMSLSHPGMAITVAAEVAQLKHIPLQDVLRQCYANTKKMYNLTDLPDA